MNSAVPRSLLLQEDRGSATAETAIVLPVILVLVLVLAVAGTGLATSLRLEGAARAAARELARGESEGSAATAAREVAGPDVHVDVSRREPWVQVRVTRELHAPAGLLRTASWHLEATASARLEPQLLGSGP